MSKTKCRLVFAAMASVAAIAGAQEASSPSGAVTNLADLSMEQLMEIHIDTVYGASKYEQKVTEAPSSITIITADEIKKFGYRTLADMLRGVRGLYVSDDRQQAQIGIRGFLRPGDYNTRLLVLIDGHRLNDNIFNSVSYERDDSIDVDLIERVEIIRGPSSSLYGSSAFFGVINVITRRGSQIDGFEVSGEAGTFDSYKERFSFGKEFKNDVEWLVSGSYYRSDGQSSLYYPEFDQRISRDARATHNGVAENLDGEDAFSVRTSLRRQDFTLSGALAGSASGIPTASFGAVFNDGGEEMTSHSGYVDLKYDHASSEDLRLLGRVFYDRSDYMMELPLFYAVPGVPPTTLLFKNGGGGECAGTEWQLTAKVLDRHTLALGGEYRENIREHVFTHVGVQPSLRLVDEDRSSRTLGLFVQDEAAILTNLTFSAGLRYDHYFESFGGTANPRLGLIYSPRKTTVLKALYGEAFRAPTPALRYLLPGQNSRPELDPEKIRTYELVCEQYFGRRYRMILSGYYYEAKDLIVQAAGSTGSIYYDNLDNVNARGVEVAMEGKFDSGLLVRASYALQRADDVKTDEELSSSPRHLAKLNLSLPVCRGKLFISPELQYQGATRTLTGGKADEFLIANLTLFSPRVTRNIEVSASVYNLFDTRYGYPGALDNLQDVIEQDGRTVRVKMTCRF